MATARFDDEARLYSAPPDEFVSRRNELAKALRDEGDKAGAARVGKLKKPSLPAWAVNAAVQANPKAADRLVKSGEALAKAQAGAAGKGGGERLRKAMSAHNDAVEAAMTGVVKALRSAGRDRPAIADRARETLRAAATDEELRAELQAGRVRADREPVGFGAAPAVAPGAGGEDEKAAAAEAEPKAERRERSKRVRAAERALEAASKRQRRAGERADKAERAAAAAGEQLQRADAERIEAESELAAAEADLEG